MEHFFCAVKIKKNGVCLIFMIDAGSRRTYKEK